MWCGRIGSTRKAPAGNYIHPLANVLPWPTTSMTPPRSEALSCSFEFLMLTLFFTLQKELQSFLDREQAQARVQQSIHTFTSMCWDKCVTFSPLFLAPPLLKFVRPDITLALFFPPRAADASLVHPRHGSLGVKRPAWLTALNDFWIQASS